MTKNFLTVTNIVNEGIKGSKISKLGLSKYLSQSLYNKKMLRFQLKQPTKLERLAIIKLAKAITLQARTFINPISNPDDFYAARKAEDALSEHNEIIRNYLKNVPGILLSKLMKELMQQLSDLLQEIFPPIGWEDLTEPFHQRHVTDRVLETLFTINLTSLTLDIDELAFVSAFISKSHMLTGLTHLVLDLKDSDEIAVYLEADIIRLLKKLHGIKSLCINLGTHNILECVIQNCKVIENLEIDNYLFISKYMIDSLTQLPNLKSIDLYESDILFLGNKFEYKLIENKKIQILNYLAEKKQFQIKSYVNYSVSRLEHLEQLVKQYPLIQKITFTQTNNEHTLQIYSEALKKLENLRELGIGWYNFYTNEVKSILEIVGKKLLSLDLLCIGELDINAVKHISVMCPYLQNLTISGYKKESEVNEFPPNVDIPPFRNLQSISLKTFEEGLEFDEIILYLLSNSPNIEIIDVSDISLKENMMIKVFDKNPLSCLKKLQIRDELTTNILDRIIENCNCSEVIVLH